MKISIKWTYTFTNTIKTNEQIVSFFVPDKIDLRWKIATTKKVKVYCRKDVRCQVYIGEGVYSLTCRNPEKFVTSLAAILIDVERKRRNKLDIHKVSVNYVKY